MISTTILAFCFAALATSQPSSSTTVSILIPIPTYQSTPGLVGSIAGVDASATTYVVTCSSSSSNSTSAAATSMGMNSSAIESSDSDGECFFPEPQTITQGPSTYKWIVGPSNANAHITYDCALTGTSQAACGFTYSGSPPVTATVPTNDSGNFHTIVTESFSGSKTLPYQRLVITAGLSNLNSSVASSTGSAIGTSSGHAKSTSTATASSSKSTSKSSSGAAVAEPALAMGAAGILAIGFAAVAL